MNIIKKLVRFCVYHFNLAKGNPPQLKFVDDLGDQIEVKLYNDQGKLRYCRTLDEEWIINYNANGAFNSISNHKFSDELKSLLVINKVLDERKYAFLGK